MKLPRSLIVSGLLLLTPVLAPAGVYKNSNFGFLVELPLSMHICTTPAPGPDHGFSMPLRSAECGKNVLQMPRVELFVEYNSPFAANSPEELAKGVCDGKNAQRSEIVSDGLPVYECLGDSLSSGRKNYFLLRILPGEMVESWTVIRVGIYSDNEVSESDLTLARRVLEKIKWNRPREVGSMKSGLRN